MCGPAPSSDKGGGGGYTEASAYRISVLSLGLTAVAVVAGFGTTAVTRSAATLGYALENVVDSVGSVLILWRFDASLTPEVMELRETRSSLGISAMLVLLGVGVGAAAAGHLAKESSTRSEGALLALSVPSVIAFGSLGLVKFRIAAAIDSPALKKDAVCSLSGAALSLGVLVSFALSEVVGVWWGDAAVAVVVGAALAGYGGTSLVRNRRLRWWTRTFWSEATSRAERKRAARAAMAELSASTSPHGML